MKIANKNDKELVLQILTKAFEENASVNYIIKKSGNKLQKVRALMDYSFDVCHLFGDVFLSDDNKACALIIYPDKKKTTLKSVCLDAKLIFKCVGLKNLKKTIQREKIISSAHPNIPISYLWFIGVSPFEQNKGIGSKLLQSIIDDCDQYNRPIYLETSTVKNLPWYKKFGFELYHEQELSYHLYFFRKEVKK